eukprot:scaffold557_cov209-Pinguiococcus_pyrenoidosus.AAC.1
MQPPEQDTKENAEASVVKVLSPGLVDPRYLFFQYARGYPEHRPFHQVAYGVKLIFGKFPEMSILPEEWRDHAYYLVSWLSGGGSDDSTEAKEDKCTFQGRFTRRPHAHTSPARVASFLLATPYDAVWLPRATCSCADPGPLLCLRCAQVDSPEGRLQRAALQRDHSC